jgi:dephospho-CoA kinase
MRTIIGISGKIGSGKNYLSQKIKSELERLGFTTSESSFAAHLKGELDSIIDNARLSLSKGEDYYSSVKVTSGKLDMSEEEVSMLMGFIEKDVKTDENVNAHSRRKGIRVALQKLGTEVRRSKDENYWVKAFHKDLPEVDFILVTDVRFPNEADSIIDKNGIVIRLEIPAEVIEERVQVRDGIQYSEEVKQHASEVSLDDYSRFDLTVGKDFELSEIIKHIMSKVGNK